MTDLKLRSVVTNQEKIDKPVTVPLIRLALALLSSQEDGYWRKTFTNQSTIVF